MRNGNETNVVCSPCLILAHPYPESQAVLERGFRRMGWDVYLARSGPEARRLARMLSADMVVLHIDLPEESGWLTCDKLIREQPSVSVILVGDDLSPRNRDLADFVGASALVDGEESMVPLVEEYLDSAAPAVRWNNISLCSPSQPSWSTWIGSRRAISLRSGITSGYFSAKALLPLSAS